MNTPLATERLIVRELCGSDFSAVHEYASDPEVTRFMWWGPNSESDTKEFIRSAIQQQSKLNRNKYDLAIVAKANNSLIGCLSLYKQPEGPGVFELGYCLNQQYWGKGFAAESISRLLKFSFDDLGFIRIISQVDPSNIPSNKIMRKLGFVLEGTLRKNILIRSEWRSTNVYALLKSEYKPSIKFEARQWGRSVC